MNGEPAHRVLYASANGDRWLLLWHAQGGTPVVRHVANAASGGHVTDASVPAFLQRDCDSPQRQALWQYLAGLLEHRTAT